MRPPNIARGVGPPGHSRSAGKHAGDAGAFIPAEFRAPVDSHDELVLLRALHAVGLTEFVCQPAVKLRSGDVVHPDLGVSALGFYVEVDHHTWHDMREAASYDKARDRQVRVAGAVVERVTDTHIRDQIAEVVAELVMLYDLRLAALGFGVERSRDVG